ncbi:hypothetical protein K7A41_23010 [Sphingobacterium sp. InxBP1]|uniref:hypothetical protein n=1 Tax=Sphingobacterium sp. InxBP1 TaxID=2870328 RepID=UPI002244788C|nr:hypothetical protein [Sphingobacterium sp. InxBP1]MCW8314115.1 hypothetical protein [Sphingobacterium sp. InxBP1]
MIRNSAVPSLQYHRPSSGTSCTVRWRRFGTMTNPSQWIAGVMPNLYRISPKAISKAARRLPEATPKPGQTEFKLLATNSL